jgi:hypothetical protein
VHVPRETGKIITMKSFIVLLSGLLLSVSCIAAKVPNSDGSSVAYVRQKDVVKVFYKGETSANVYVSIYDDHLKQVFRETIRKVNGFSKPYNLSDLPAGTYSIRVSVGNRVISKLEQVVITNEPAVQENVLDYNTVAHLTKLKDSCGKYVLSIPYRGNDHLSVRIYDERLRMVYLSAFDVSGETAFVINAEALKGNYSMDVVTKNEIINTFQLTNP